MSRTLSFTLLVGVASAWHMTPPERLTRVSTACHAEKPAVSRADFLSGLALGASAIAAPAFAETPRNDVTSYDKIPNQSGLQKKVTDAFSEDYINIQGVDRKKVGQSTKAAALAKRDELAAAAKARKEELKAKGKAEAAAVLEANKARGQAGKDAAANLKAAKAAKKEEGKAAARAKREADLAAQAEKKAAKAAKKAAAKK